MAEWLRRGLQIPEEWRKTAIVYNFRPPFATPGHAWAAVKVQTRQGRLFDVLMHIPLDVLRKESISRITIRKGDSDVNSDT
jgi:hypothetical protein